MKRFLLSSVLLLAMGLVAFGFENDNNIQVPPMDPMTVQIDDPVFINNGFFSVQISQSSVGSTILFETSDTLNYTNNGNMSALPGFDFENFPASFGQAHMADNFVNNADGFGGGVISATGQFSGLNAFALGGSSFPLNFEVVGLPTVKIRATNVIDTGLITMDNTGLIDILGQNVDLRRAQFQMTGGLSFANSSAGVSVLDFGFGTFGSNSAPWAPATDLGTGVIEQSPVFTNASGFGEQMQLFNATSYFQDTAPTTNANGVIVWRIIFLQDFSAPSVTPSVYFDSSTAGNGAFHIQWAGAYRDQASGGTATNYFVLSDVPVNRRNTNTFNTQGGIPSNFSFAEGTTPQVVGTPATPSFVPDPFAPTSVTNDFSYINLHPTPVLVDTNQVIGGSPTNMPGRIQLSSLDSMNLADTAIVGANYVSLRAPNFLGNSNSFIAAPYADVYLGVTNGSMAVSNLLAPSIAAWNLEPGGFEAVSPVGPITTTAGGGTTFFQNGGIEAFSGSYFFVDTNGITNDVRILMVNSALQPTTPSLEKDMELHTSSDLVINDNLTIFGNFFSDATKLTVATNASSAYSPFGTLLLLNAGNIWSASLPNLQYLTNWGIITTTNTANFADNMPNLFSPRSQAVPYQAFVNHGLIVNQGAFIDANYFENDGLLLENATGDFNIGGSSAGIDIRAGTGIITNGTLITTNGPVSIAANSLLVSNSMIIAGRTLTFSTSCFLSDGYAFGNEFGHATNASLPNVVTNGNTFVTAGGVRVFAPATVTGDLLGTTITNISLSGQGTFNAWSGQDRGVSPSGFAENLALGRMIFNSDSSLGHFTFVPTTGNNALYVDSIELQGYSTNTDAQGNYTAFTIQPGMKIYFAQALENGVSIAEKLNGKNGGRFVWVGNYAGVYSATNLNGTLYNEALVISPDIDTDGDTIVNRDDPTPIPAGLTYDVSNAGPIACAGGSNPPGDPPGNPFATNNSTPGLLTFPAEQQQGGSGGSGSVSFVSAQGSYNGLFYDATNGVNPASAGSFTANLNKKGVFTAKLQLGANTYSLTKSFDATGNFGPLTFSPKNLPALTVTLQLVNNDEITGQVSGVDGWTAQLLAFRAVKNANSFGTGKHSLVLGLNAGSSTTTSGDGYGAMTLNKNGNIQWSGALPDGSKVSDKSVLSKDGVWPLYSSLYGGNGALIGWLQVTNTSSDIGGSVIWVAPAHTNSPFPNGVTNQFDATGSALSAAPTASQMTVILSGPQLSESVTNHVTISGKSGSGDNSLKLSLDVKNGLFNGSLVDPNSSQILSFQGALLENSGIGGGFFLNAGKNQGGKVSLAPAN